MDKITHNLICMFIWGLYIGITFLLPLNKNSAFWLAFGVGTFSTMLHITTMQIALGNNNVAKSKLESWSVVNIGYTIIFAQVIMGLGTMLWTQNFSFATVFLIEIILVVLGIANLIMVDTAKDEQAREEIASIAEIQSIDIKCLDSLTSKVMLLMKNNKDARLVHVFDVMYELVRYYDPILHDEDLAQLEKEINRVLDSMAIILPRNDIDNTLTCCKIITRLLEERNMKLKILKDKEQNRKQKEIQKEMEEEFKKQKKMAEDIESHIYVNDDEIIP